MGSVAKLESAGTADEYPRSHRVCTLCPCIGVVLKS
jgi:hypothetical protein